jgi:hypothetical protein
MVPPYIPRLEKLKGFQRASLKPQPPAFDADRTCALDTVANAAWWWSQRGEGRFLDYVGRRELAYINVRFDLDRGVRNVEVVRKLITNVC